MSNTAEAIEIIKFNRVSKEPLRHKTRMPVNFSFTDEEHELLYHLLREIPGSPFRDYAGFQHNRRGLIESGRIPVRF